MRDGVWVERLFIPGEYKYRITIALQGVNKTAEISADYFESVPALIQETIYRMFQEWAENIFQNILVCKDRTGDFDNTQELYRTRQFEEQTRLEQQRMRRDEFDYRVRITRNVPRLSDVALRDIQNAYSGMTGEDWYGARVMVPKKSKNTPERRSMHLLYKAIGRRNARMLKKNGYFEVSGRHGIYRFMLNDLGGVKFIQNHTFGKKTRQVEWSLCVQSTKADMPKGDVILSRYLEWKTDEDKFLETANFRTIHTQDEAIAR